MNTASIFLLCMALAAPAAEAAGKPSAPAASGRAPSAPSQSATDLVGFISPMQGVGICMDGATHLIHSATGDFRLKAANAEASKALAEVANGKERVTLAGRRVQGPECIYFSVQAVTRTVHN